MCSSGHFRWRHLSVKSFVWLLRLHRIFAMSFLHRWYVTLQLSWGSWLENVLLRADFSYKCIMVQPRDNAEFIQYEEFWSPGKTFKGWFIATSSADSSLALFKPHPLYFFVYFNLSLWVSIVFFSKQNPAEQHWPFPKKYLKYHLVWYSGFSRWTSVLLHVPGV